MRQVVVPVKFSFLALLCARKATIFSTDLIKLMYKVSNYIFDGLQICIDKFSFIKEETQQDKDLAEKFF